jgi:hypothetical protein
MFLQESTCPISAFLAIPIIPKTIHGIVELERDSKAIELRIQSWVNENRPIWDNISKEEGFN